MIFKSEMTEGGLFFRAVAISCSNQEAKDELKKWEINLDTGLVEFDGRLLESEQILYANRSIRYKHDEADWSREGLIVHSLTQLFFFFRSYFTTYRMQKSEKLDCLLPILVA